MNDACRIIGAIPCDERFNITRHTDHQFPITKFSSREEVDARREELRYNLRMAAGLYPWPDKTPLTPKYELVGEYEGYTVKKVMFQSHPGLWSTGNLYLPDPMPKGKAPAILNVIGHWETQRLNRSETADYPQQIANFARMGFICLVTDMIGKVDSLQLSHEYGKDEKELWCSNGLGVQLWNNIRALDLLCSMPEVDADNIGCTGASGGGSQTLFLALVDERVKAAAPINMISLHMQGGCQCENAPGLRRFTDNSEMCAMIAPRALFLAGSTGDWTKYQETMEYPAMLEAYRQYGAENMVEHFYQDAPHQYNDKTRHRVYSFFARHLMGNDPEWIEQPVEVEDLSALTWFDGNGHAPGFENDDEFFAYHKKERAEKIGGLCACEKLKMLKWITGTDGISASISNVNTTKADGMTVECGIISDGGENVPYTKLIPDNADGRVCLMLGDSGCGILDSDKAKQLVSDGVTVIGGDLFMTGAKIGERKIEEGFKKAKYFTTFNYTDDACRIRDIVRLWTLTDGAENACVIASGSVSRNAACALAMLDGIRYAELDKSALEIDGDSEYYEKFFIPGLLSIGGIKGAMELAKCEIK